MRYSEMYFEINIKTKYWVHSLIYIFQIFVLKKKNVTLFFFLIEIEVV